MPSDRPDAKVANCGSIFLVQPLTDRARDWIDEHTGEEVSFFGGSLVVEHRYIQDFVRGMIEDGLAVK